MYMYHEFCSATHVRAENFRISLNVHLNVYVYGENSIALVSFKLIYEFESFKWIACCDFCCRCHGIPIRLNLAYEGFILIRKTSYTCSKRLCRVGRWRLREISFQRHFFKLSRDYTQTSESRSLKLFKSFASLHFLRSVQKGHSIFNVYLSVRENTYTLIRVIFTYFLLKVSTKMYTCTLGICNRYYGTLHPKFACKDFWGDLYVLSRTYIYVNV